MLNCWRHVAAQEDRGFHLECTLELLLINLSIIVRVVLDEEFQNVGPGGFPGGRDVRKVLCRRMLSQRINPTV